jgi:hypothetical protein
MRDGIKIKKHIANWLPGALEKKYHGGTSVFN